MKVILKLLNNPKQARIQAERGYQLMLKRYNHHKYIQAFVEQITSFEKDTSK